MNDIELHLLVQSKCKRVPLFNCKEELENPSGILESDYRKVRDELLKKEKLIMSNVVYYKNVCMTEDRYQYLNSLSLDEYDRDISWDEQEAFLEYQHKYHPDEVMYYQGHNPD